MTTSMIILLVIFFWVNVADVAQTLYLLRHGGRELNPVIAALIDSVGELPGLLLGKVIMVVAAIVFIKFDALYPLAILTALVTAALWLGSRRT